MEGYEGAALFQQVHNLKGRALARVVDILFVTDSDDKDAGVLQGALRSLAKRLGNLLDDPLRHRRVDLARQFNEPRCDIEFACLPRQIKRVDWDAMSTEPGAGIKRHIAKRLCLGGLNNLPDIDVHRLENDLHLIYQGDVDSTKNVLGQLYGLGRLQRRHWDGRCDELAVKGTRQRQCFGSVGTYDLWDFVGKERDVSGVLTLRGVREKEIPAGTQPRTL